MKHTDENPRVIEITTQTAAKKNYTAPTGPLSLSLSETEFGFGLGVDGFNTTSS